jgi:hypothetical protein
MNDHARENLIELLERFMDGPSAEAADDEIRAGEGLLEAYPAPAADARTIAALKVRMVAAAQRRHRKARILQGVGAAAAAVVVMSLIGLLGRGPTRSIPGVTYAGIIPTAIWESDDLATDDLDLAYYTAEIRRIEAQMRAVEAGDANTHGGDTLEELEMELMRIETEFWKG